MVNLFSTWGWYRVLHRMWFVLGFIYPTSLWFLCLNIFWMSSNISLHLSSRMCNKYQHGLICTILCITKIDFFVHLLQLFNTFGGIKNQPKTEPHKSDSSKDDLKAMYIICECLDSSSLRKLLLINMCYVSLCDNYFYLLIERETKWMSYDKKATYRIEHGIPSTIDEWISDGKMHTKAPTANPHRRGPTGEYPLWQDNVKCILNVVCKKVSIW